MADAGEEFRRLIVEALAADGSMEVAAETGDGEEAVRLAGELRPDVVVLDLDRITDRATFDQPNAGPEGLDYVLVGGEVAVDHDRVVRSDLGRAVRKH